MAVDVVSVLMPVYNAGRYLRTAVTSILGQDDSRLELVAVDDGSTDGSLRVLRQLARHDARLRVLSVEHVGYTRAMQAALGECRGEFIARMDADDRSTPYRLRVQRAFLESHTACAAVGGQVMVIDHHGWQVHPLERPLEHEQIDQRHMQMLGGGIMHPAAMLRRAAFDDVGGYRSAFEPAEDYDLWLRLAERWRLANVPERVLHYRLHPANVSTRRRVAQDDARWRALREACARRGLAFDVPPPTSDVPTLGDQLVSLSESAFHSRRFLCACKLAVEGLVWSQSRPLAWRQTCRLGWYAWLALRARAMRVLGHVPSQPG